jgi:hypothetical protein
MKNRLDMERYLKSPVLHDLMKKMVFVTGPRQVGKTYFARDLRQHFKKPQYLNFDNSEDARIIKAENWALDTDFLILDEIHKMKKWKIFCKGVYDSRPQEQSILITGSARLDTFRQGGESLAGRYYHYRLHPFSVKELRQVFSPFEALHMLNQFGGFPEPFLSQSEEESRRWRRQYYTDIIREDILEYSRLHELKAMQMLLELLRERTGSILSYNSLSRDLQIAPNTVKRYVEILESLYIIFLIKPFSSRLARSILREPKLYFFDTGFIKGDEGKKLENTCAVCLLKHVHFLQDKTGKDITLHFLRTKDGREADFALAQDDHLEQVIEIKLSDGKPNPSLAHFKKQVPDAQFIQLIHNLRQEQNVDGISLYRAGDWLAGLEA